MTNAEDFPDLRVVEIPAETFIFVGHGTRPTPVYHRFNDDGQIVAFVSLWRHDTEKFQMYEGHGWKWSAATAELMKAIRKDLFGIVHTPSPASST